MAKRLLVTSTELMMIQFLVPHVKNLVENGFEVEIACSEVAGRLDEVREALKDHVKAIHKVRLYRNPAQPKNLLGYKDMEKVINQGNYDFIWTNEPVMGVMTRLAARKARKNGTKVIYMVHGFHFFKGASILNWMVFYPVEKFASRFCDEIVTINKEDYSRAKKMYAHHVSYIHGIGINTQRLQNIEKQCDIRKELGLKDEDIILLSVGELSKRKNHQVILRALGELQRGNLHYVICGKGKMLEQLRAIAVSMKIQDNVHFLGYRKDVVDICSQSNIFILPSLQEGLSVASLEAMYCGLPIIISDIRGVRDYIVNQKNGFICNAKQPSGFKIAICKLLDNKDLQVKMGRLNKVAVKPFCIEESIQEVKAIFDKY